MITQQVKSILEARTFTSIVIFGIEVRFCVDRIQLGHLPHVSRMFAFCRQFCPFSL